VHQAALGSAHAVEDVEAARRWMVTEIASLSQGSQEPVMDILRPDSQLVRVHLRSYLAEGGDSEELLDAFVYTSNSFTGSTDVLERYWHYARRSVASGDLPFTQQAMDVFFVRQARRGHPAVHHSSRYVEEYAPAYRVILQGCLLHATSMFGC